MTFLKVAKKHLKEKKLKNLSRKIIFEYSNNKQSEVSNSVKKHNHNVLIDV